jgi:hypothetical protein
MYAKDVSAEITVGGDVFLNHWWKSVIGLFVQVP